MDRIDADMPPDVNDRDLWRGAADMAARHQPDPGNPGRCSNQDCSDPQPYPCFARRLAERSALASRIARTDDSMDIDRSTPNASYRSVFGSAEAVNGQSLNRA